MSDRTDDATRRDLLGLAGVGVATALSAAPLVAGALDPPDTVARTVPPDTFRIGPRWEGTHVGLEMDGSLGMAVDEAPGDGDTEWLQVRVRRPVEDWPGELLVRKGTCVEVEARKGRFAAIEGVLTGFVTGARRVRVQVPTGGTGPPARAGDPPGGPTSIRSHDRGTPPESAPGGPLSVFRRVDVSDQLSFGEILHELATRFDGSIPAVAGEGVFDPLPRNRPFPVDEDYACTEAARD